MMHRSFRPRVIMLNQMAGPMTWELAEDLADQFGEVALLTGHPDTLAKPSRHGLRVDRSVEYRRGNMLRRSWTWCCYLVHAFFWLWKWPATTPLLLFSNPPLLVWLAWAMGRLRGTRYAVMVHDIYPDVAIRLGQLRASGLAARVWRWLNRRAYQRADLVMTLTPNMAKILETHFDVLATPSGRVHVIYPWADTDRIRPIDPRHNTFAGEHHQLDKLTVLYAGNMGLGHDLETMLAAARALQHDQRFHFMFVGAGPKWATVERGIREHSLNNATLLPWQPEARLAEVLSTADLAVVSLESELAGLAIPSKAFYALAAGTPLIVLCAKESDLGELVRRYQCGWQLSPGDVDRFVALVREMGDSPDRLQGLKTASRNAALRCATRRDSSGKIAGLLKAFLTTPPHGDRAVIECYHHADR